MPAKDLRFVVVHHPGPKWVADVSLFQQDGLQEHVDHYRTMFEIARCQPDGNWLFDMDMPFGTPAS